MASMSVRQRGKKKSKENEPRFDIEEKKRTKHRRSDMVVFALILYLLFLTYATLLSHWHLPAPNLSTDGNHFSTLNARKHLKAITDVGIRHAGSQNNDIQTRDIILSAIETIKRQASPEVEIEVSLHHPSGHFNLDFLGRLTHLYENLTNIVVRFGRHGSTKENALLINCHFDSALGSISASDDAASCSVLLEALRCMSSSPSPYLLKHSVILLFNGAEEMILPASHGFVTQHPWAPQVKAFLNLESAGAGGKEMVFQTGPEHPWLAKSYAKSVPYPHSSVVAQELFQAGIIPSDTDFRIFRDYGNIPGIDMAYYINGYVYHTKYDTADRIPDGSIQRAGENILALVNQIANSDTLVNPEDDRHGKVTYFDVLGLSSVVYPERIGLILNFITLILTVVGLILEGWKKTMRERLALYVLIMKSIGISLVSILGGLMATLLSGLLTTATGKTLMYYANPLLIIPLFFFPVIIGMSLVDYWWRSKNSNVSCEQFERIMLCSKQIILWLILLIATYYRLSSSCVPMFLLLFLVVFRTLLWDNCLSGYIQSKVGFILAYMMAMLPLIFLILSNIITLDLFIPMMGRFGSVISCDIFMAVISSMVVSLLLFYPISSLVNYCTEFTFKMIMIGFVSGWLIAMIAILAGFIFPFSGDEPVYPKRLYFQHARVDNHYNPDASYSGVVINVLDYRELDDLIQHMPQLEKARIIDCQGVYCGLPAYLPLLHMMKRSWLIPGPNPQRDSIEISLASVNHTSPDTRNYSFVATFPHNARVVLEPLDGLQLWSWSFDASIPPKTPYGDGKGCYYILYTRGTGNGKTHFWLEIKGDVNVVPAIEMGTIALYINDPLSRTPMIEELEAATPKWASPISWTAIMDINRF
jgi:MFS family permease